ncbi:MAG: hypothetical protein DLM72_06145 [Candidatus Nitrosopolaris wilkensis]|nr:MAG: hypothetical protein DLM72_06145 [Candidatus Nitrosopolaris wilkensis]
MGKVLLEYANSCALLVELIGTPNLIQPFRGRTTTPKFSFDVNGSQLTVHRAQIEVDSGFERRLYYLNHLFWYSPIVLSL